MVAPRSRKAPRVIDSCFADRVLANTLTTSSSTAHLIDGPDHRPQQPNDHASDHQQPTRAAYPNPTTNAVRRDLPLQQTHPCRCRPGGTCR